MKLAVFSDTHGRCEAMLAMARRMKGVDLFVHLGDHVEDAARLADAVWLVRTVCVAGNGDLGSGEKTELVLETGGFLTVAVHGHRQSVKFSSFGLLALAKQRGARLVLFGHTHSAEIFTQDGVTFVCPGTAGGIGHSPTAAMVETVNGEPFCHLIDL